ncbi:hypothetical protein V8D89_011322 [Ganoderma adspersum]
MSSPNQTAITAAQEILERNHATALKWFEVHGKDKQDWEWDNWYAWARYRYQVGGPDDEMFEFAFSKPTLSFICDHDALLHVGIESVSKVTPDERHLMQPAAITRSYRIPTSHRAIVGNDMKLGDHESRIRLLVCDFDHATFVNSEGKIDKELEPNIERYLSSYLKALQSGGHHVLSFPPEFSEDDKRPDIHLSLASNRRDRVSLDNIFGCTAQMIGSYLSLFWYTCAFIAREGGKRDRIAWYKSSPLASYKSWLFPDLKSEFKDWHVSFEIQEPTATILCSREVVLQFVLTKVSIYKASECPDGQNIVEKSNADCGNWTIGLSVDIFASKAAIIIRPASARHSPGFTKDPKDGKDVDEEKRGVLTHFFIERYFKLIAATHLKYLFRRIEAEYIDVSPSGGVDFDGSWWMLERSSDFGTRVDSSHIADTTMKNFDVIIAAPMSNLDGDLLFELRPFRTASKAPERNSTSTGIDTAPEPSPAATKPSSSTTPSLRVNTTNKPTDEASKLQPLFRGRNLCCRHHQLRYPQKQTERTKLGILPISVYLVNRQFGHPVALQIGQSPILSRWPLYDYLGS